MELCCTYGALWVYVVLNILRKNFFVGVKLRVRKFINLSACFGAAILEMVDPSFSVFAEKRFVKKSKFISHGLELDYTRRDVKKM